MSDIITVEGLNLWYGKHQALKNVCLRIPEKSITALIGPSGCGKSTFLKTLNRMNDLIPDVKITGDVRYQGENIFQQDVERAAAADRHGVSEAQPLSHEHLRQHRLRPPHPRRARPGPSWTTLWSAPCGEAAIWDEVKDRLQKERPGPFRRPAAAPVHRPGAGGAARRCC